MEYIVTFFTQAAAIKYQRMMAKNSIVVELLPIPRELSSNCGVGARLTMEEDIKEHLLDDIEKIFLVNKKVYELIYENM